MTDLNTPVVAPPTGPVDAVPPVVNVTAPADGATVSGTIDVTATATDDTGVAGVQLLIDGTNAGPEDTTSPYTLPWNTVGAANGPHTITARARDLGGNLTTSAPVTVTVTNTADSGLLAAYGMETGSGTTLTDSSPNAANAELTDGTWTTGRYGNAVAFNGTTTRARTSANLNLGSAFTLQAWVNNPTNEAYETILTVGQERSLFLENGQLGLDAGGTVVSFGPLPTAVWTHVAVTYDGTALQAYVDGMPLGAPQAIALAPVTGPVQVGAWIFGAADVDYFSGTLDEVRVQSRALTQAEILADLAIAVVAPPAPPVDPGPVVTVPPTTVPATTVPPTTMPATTVPPTTVPPTTVPPTTVPPTTVPVAGPVLAYGFNEGTGSSAASTAAGPAATVTSGTWTTGRYGAAIAFDGSTSRVRTDSELTLGTTFTIEAWVNNAGAQPYETIMTVGQNRNLYLRNGQLRFSTGATFVSFGTALPTAVWTHVAVTYDGTTMRAYADGVLLGTPQAIALTPVTAALQVGAWISGANNFDYLSGAVDEVRFYDRALSPTEIQADLGTPIG